MEVCSRGCLRCRCEKSDCPARPCTPPLALATTHSQPLLPSLQRPISAFKNRSRAGDSFQKMLFWTSSQQRAFSLSYSPEHLLAMYMLPGRVDPKLNESRCRIRWWDMNTTGTSAAWNLPRHSLHPGKHLFLPAWKCTVTVHRER